MKSDIIINDFIWGTIDTLEAKSIPRGTASKSLNWLTEIDRIELRRGYNLLGNEGSAGKIYSVFVAKMANGTEIPFRKNGQKLEYYILATLTWTEIGTNIFGSTAETEDAYFAEYHSLAGDQLFISSPNSSLFKVMLANPASYTDIYDSTKNYKGYIKIKQNRMFLWGRVKDKTGLYLSKIDTENYTTVSNENVGTGDGSTKTFTDTLAYKAAGAKRTCFAIEVTDGVETFTDNNDGTLTGSAGGTGTINYTSGAISLTFNASVGGGTAILCDYQWVDDTVNGIADFTYSGTRVASEGAVFRQDDGGNLQTIESYGAEEYCLHESKTWVLELTADDTNATNLIYREKLGIPSIRAAVATAEGIYCVDISDEKDPQIKLLSYSLYSDKVNSSPISKGVRYKNKDVGIDLSGYYFDKSVGKEWGDCILFTCRTSSETENNRVILYNKRKKTIDVLDYWVSCFAVYNGTLIAGDSYTQNVYSLFSLWDDDESLIGNYWESNEDNLNFEGMKKLKRLIIKGLIAKEQSIKISISTDNSNFIEIETIEGDESYVDIGKEVSVGRNTIGSEIVGGGSGGAYAYNFIKEINPVILDKFNTIKLRIEALEMGFCSLNEIIYHDIRYKNQKILKRYRS